VQSRRCCALARPRHNRVAPQSSRSVEGPDPGGPPCGPDTRRERHGGDDDDYGGERRRIGWFDAEKQVPQQARTAGRADEAERDGTPISIRAVRLHDAGVSGQAGEEVFVESRAS